jgi:acetoin utilization deacetylase AcuC-like enzyme
LATGYVWLQEYAWHDTGLQHVLGTTGRPDHPLQNQESPESKSRLASLVEASGLIDHLVRLAVEPASDEDVLRVHTPGHLARLRRESLEPKGGDAGDGISPFGHGGLEIALLAAGGAMAAVGAALERRITNGYALIRPPGHHAISSTGMGFCMLSNIGIAIRWARERHGVDRVAIVDWDVHHGNGTQEIFYEDPATLTISLHQDNLYPFGSGTLEERGAGAAEGYAINVPLPAGSGNGAYLEALRRVVAPALRAFHPEIILVASGFDSSILDPFGRMMVTATGYRAMTLLLMELADELCDGRLVMIHEGGYSPLYVPFCGVAVIETLAGVETGIEMPWDDEWNRLPDQAISGRQAEIIDRAALLAGSLGTGTVSPIRR